MLKLNIKTSIPVPNNIMWGKNQNWNSFNETNTIRILNIIWKNLCFYCLHYFIIALFLLFVLSIIN